MQAHLFGEPELKPSLSQWHTPAWLARRMAEWVPRGSFVLEPSCGGGALLEALLRAGHPAHLLRGIELDREWVTRCRAKMPGVVVLNGDFLTGTQFSARTDVVLMNPPFEDNLHMRFVLRALELAPVVGVFPASFECGQERDRELWATRGVVTRRARLPGRVDYGGGGATSFDSVVLQIERREAPRAPGDVHLVREEVWCP